MRNSLRVNTAAALCLTALLWMSASDSDSVRMNSKSAIFETIVRILGARFAPLAK